MDHITTTEKQAQLAQQGSALNSTLTNGDSTAAYSSWASAESLSPKLNQLDPGLMVCCCRGTNIYSLAIVFNLIAPLLQLYESHLKTQGKRMQNVKYTHFLLLLATFTMC